jgi:hypothetical protein
MGVSIGRSMTPRGGPIDCPLDARVSFYPSVLQWLMRTQTIYLLNKICTVNLFSCKYKGFAVFFAEITFVTFIYSVYFLAKLYLWNMIKIVKNNIIRQ